MHPIEHLRYVARAQGVDAASLVEETAHALGSLSFDPSGLVVACRRIVERHPFTGPLWWLCAHLATAPDPFDRVWDLVGEMNDDPTGPALGAELADDATVATIGAPHVIGDGLIRRGDLRVLALDAAHAASAFVRRLDRHDVAVEPVDAGSAGAVARSVDAVLVEALAVDTTRAIVPIGSSTLAAAACGWGTPVWLVAGVGRRLPTPMVDAMVGRVEQFAATADPWDADVEVLPVRLLTDVIGPGGRTPAGPAAFGPECPMAHELLRSSAM